jgi:hypothetical protein
VAISQAGMSDASFFSLVHHVLRAHPPGQAGGSEADRYRSARMQYVAPYLDGRFPDPSQFEQVRCHDLSLSGFSYLIENRPDYDQVIVALGTAPLILMSARVTRQAPTMVEGQSCHIVECHFTARIENCDFDLTVDDVASDVSRTVAAGRSR